MASKNVTAKWICAGIGVLLLCFGMARAAGHRHAPTGTYTDWNWPEVPQASDGTSGYRSFEHELTPEVDPGPSVGYFWSHQVAFVGGEIGYFGLQTLGERPHASTGKVAIFSIWNALGARGPGIAQPFGGEGVGFQTLVPFAWKAGHAYRMQLARTGASRQGTEWTARVGEASSGRLNVIGVITVPRAWGGLSSSSVMWSERYTGPDIHTCADVGYSRALFHEPRANDGTVRPLSHRNYLSDPVNCPNSRVSDAGTGARQEMGIVR